MSAWNGEREGDQWRAIGQCSRGDSCSFGHWNNRGQQAQFSEGEKVLLEGKVKKRAKVSAKEIAQIRRVMASSSMSKLHI